MTLAPWSAAQRMACEMPATEPEPRPGLRGGHIPGAKSVPWAKAIDPETHTFKPASELKKLYEQDNSLKKDKETIARFASQPPLERLGVPSDIVEAVAFLAGPGHWVNGQVLRVNGGID